MSWEIQRTTGRPLHRTDDDRLALPLSLFRSGEHTVDAQLTLSLAEAEHLHAALCRALDSRPAPVNAPDCRKAVQASAGNARTVGYA